MARRGIIVAVSLVLLVVLASCSPGATPSPTPTPASPRSTAAAPTQAAPTVSPDEAAWQEVVKTAQKQGKVTLYGNLAPDLVTGMTSQFQKAYGINLEIMNATAAVNYERIKTEQRAGVATANVFQATSTFTVQANTEGLLVDFGNLPILKQNGVWNVGPVLTSQRIVYFYPFINTAWVNTQLVKPEQEPKSWLELLQPQWKGKMVISDPVSTPNASELYVMMLKNKIMNDADFKTLSGQDIKYSPTARDSLSMLARGEVSLNMDMATVTAVPMLQEGAPLKAIGFKEGVIVAGTSAGIVKGSPHTEAARVFLNWLLSQEGQTIVAKAVGRSVRKDVTDFTPAAARVEAVLLEEAVPDMAEISRLQSSQFVSNMWKK